MAFLQLLQLAFHVADAPPKSPDGFSIQYLRVHDHSTIATTNPDCNYFEPEDLGRKVDDKCCDLSKWPAGSGATQTPPDTRTKPGGNKTWRCYVMERVAVPGTYVRNFFGCEGGKLKAAEDCAPAGTSFGHGYPMTNKTLALESFVDGNSHSCGCKQPGYVGEGCFVALSSYIAGIGVDKTANFLSLSGDCSAIEDRSGGFKVMVRLSSLLAFVSLALVAQVPS